MRPRFAVLVSGLCALAAVSLPGVAGAQVASSALTINATPNPILAGEGVLIYGQLNAAPVAGQTIVLYHHIAGVGGGYTAVSRTTTNAFGFYEFTRAEGLVDTNRSWFVREARSGGPQSGVVVEQVAALVSLAASAQTADAGTPVTFTGHVTPDHAGEPVLLQEENATTNVWVTIKAGQLDANSNYSIPYVWPTPGVRNVRVVFGGDARNTAGVSSTVAVTIQQGQVPGFTISSSQPIIGDGQAVTISGVLDKPGTAVPAPGVVVELWARSVGEVQSPSAAAVAHPFRVVEFTTTNANGAYAFLRMPGHNVVYQARTAFAPYEHTIGLFQGVADVLAMGASSPTATVGGTVTFTGLAAPDAAGEAVYLQRLGADGQWHNIAVRLVRANSTYQFVWRFAQAGTDEFRAAIPGDPANVEGASLPVTITVSGLAPVSSLPKAGHRS